MRRLRHLLLLPLLACAFVAGPANALPITLDGAVILTNTLDSPAQFTILYTLPTLPLTGLFESVLTVSGELIDNRQDGVSMTPVAPALGVAQAIINGLDIVDLVLGPAQNTAGTWGPLTLSAIIDSANYGGSINTIGLRYSFIASAYDTISLTGSHTLQEASAPVPVPATLLLLGSGLIALGVLRRRAA